MARNQSGDFLQQSSGIKFLTTPFRWAVVIVVVVLILFTTSVLIQAYFHEPMLLQNELAQTSSIFEHGGAPLGYHIVITRFCYRVLHIVFFDMTGLTTIFDTGNTDGISASLQSVLSPLEPHLKTLDNTLKVIALRLGNLAAYFPLMLLVVTAAVFDGLMQRRIRQQNAARESAAIYHRAKYWRSGIIWATVMLYLSLPFSIKPSLLVVPVLVLSVFTFLQAKYLKKYL